MKKKIFLSEADRSLPLSALMQKYNISKATASRARHRGWFWRDFFSHEPVPPAPEDFKEELASILPDTISKIESYFHGAFSDEELREIREQTEKICLRKWESIAIGSLGNYAFQVASNAARKILQGKSRQFRNYRLDRGDVEHLKNWAARLSKSRGHSITVTDILEKISQASPEIFKTWIGKAREQIDELYNTQFTLSRGAHTHLKRLARENNLRLYQLFSIIALPEFQEWAEKNELI